MDSFKKNDITFNYELLNKVLGFMVPFKIPEINSNFLISFSLVISSLGDIKYLKFNIQ